MGGVNINRKFIYIFTFLIIVLVKFFDKEKITEKALKELK